MNNAEIKDFKKYVRETLIKKYHMSEVEAHRAVRDSYLSFALQRDNGYVDHDTVEDWADFIYDEVQDKHLMQM